MSTITPCTSLNRPTASTGRIAFETDTKNVIVYDGTAWRGYGNDGIPFAKGSTSADFDGSDDYISIADADNLSFGDGSTDSSFSLSAWINPDTVAGFRILAKSTPTNAEYVWSCDAGGDLRVWICDNNLSNSIGVEDSTNSVTTGWQHVVLTYNGSGSNLGIKLYRNNNLLSTTGANSGSYTAMENLAMPLEIGRLNTSVPSFADGHMDDVAVIAKELSASEIDKIYNNNIYPSETVSLWRFEGNANDSRGSNNGTGQNGVVLNSTDVRS